jgi:outer membrane protein G
MKRIILLMLLTASFTYAQVYNGKGDVKLQIGANLQKDGTGVAASFDLGLSENMSIGLMSSYLLNTATYLGTPKFVDRFDLKARFNANIGNVLNIDDNLDIYPGLNLGLKNFGGHLGARYFFTDSFGIFSEASFPIAKYENQITGYDYLNNQFTFNIGASFNL